MAFCFDMDGVLADFFKEPRHLERFKNEKGFFRKLEPIKNNLAIINKLLDLKVNVFIISTSPHEQADKEKRAWLGEHLPRLTTNNIILTRPNESKAKALGRTLTKGDILIDDHTKNLIEWQQQGGQPIKYLNGINGKNGTHKKHNIPTF
jgi:5'(3')-deoxyribonucleotidase